MEHTYSEMQYMDLPFFKHDNPEGELLYYEFAEDLSEFYRVGFGNYEVQEVVEKYVQDAGIDIDDVVLDTEADTFVFRSMKEENMRNIIDILVSEEFKRKVKNYLDDEDYEE